MAPAVVFVSCAVIAILRPEFLHLPSLTLTLGGSIAVVLFSYSPGQLKDLYHVARTLLAETPTTSRKHADGLSRLTTLYRAQGLRGLEQAERRLVDPFLRRAVSMAVDLQKEEKIVAALDRDLADVLAQHELSRQVLLTLGKVLPAFGLIGTLVGMVLLLHDLYAENVESLPAALSLSVLTTLYGAVFANVVVAPLAARLHAAATEKELRMRMTFDWIVTVVRGDGAARAAHNGADQRPALKAGRSGLDRGWATLTPSALP
jgi:chemotaxis protein MotA